jgi:hypothetical protein
MARPPRFSTRRLPESLRSRLEVATSLAWEAVVDAHVAQALAVINLLDDRLPLEDALPRYLMEVDLNDAMTSAVRSRVLAASDADPVPDTDVEPTIAIRTDGEKDAGAADEGSTDASAEPGWRRFRPDIVVRDFRERQRRDEETESLIKLALARAEENVIATHVDNALTFVALLDDVVTLDRAVQVYLEAAALTGGRAQTVHQRTMARLADVHLPLPRPRN